LSNITIYHNPACGTSQYAEMIRNSGIEPTVILYLETPPSRDELLKLHCGYWHLRPALRMRKNVEPYQELGLAERSVY
jgi:arsenate reductase